MTMIHQDALGLPALNLNYILDVGVSPHVQVKWGNGYRWIITIGSNTYPHKGDAGI